MNIAYAGLLNLSSCSGSGCSNIDNNTVQSSELISASSSIESDTSKKVFDLLTATVSLKPNKDDPVNILEAYPDEKKLAFIINGDSQEQRHITNVETTIDVLAEKGFNEFYVVSDQPLLRQADLNIHQYAGSLRGAQVMFDELEGSIEKDDLIFGHVTGHGHKNLLMVPSSQLYWVRALTQTIYLWMT